MPQQVQLFGTKNDGSFMPDRVQTDSEGRLLVTSSPTLGDDAGAYSVDVPTSSAAAGLAPVVDQGVFSKVIKAAPGNLYEGSIVAGATAGFLIAYNDTVAPASAAALTAAKVLDVVPVAANGFASFSDHEVPDYFSTGIVLLFSTSLTNFTEPANAAAFIRGKAA